MISKDETHHPPPVASKVVSAKVPLVPRAVRGREVVLGTAHPWRNGETVDKDAFGQTPADQLGWL